MVLTRSLQRRVRPEKIFNWKDKRDWVILLVISTAAPVYSLYHLFSAGGAAAADEAVAGTIDGARRLAELKTLEPVKVENKMITL